MAYVDALGSYGKESQYSHLQQKAISAYSTALQEALAPLAERYRHALKELTDTQEGYYRELGQRISAAYQSYAENLAAIPAGSASLEQTVEAYTSFAGAYQDYVDPARWTEMIAPAQDGLQTALADAQGSDNTAQDMQEAVEAFYQEINDVLQGDSGLQSLVDAQEDYAKQLGALTSDMERDWRHAVETVNDSLARAAEDTAAAFDIEAALRAFTEELKAIGAEVADAYQNAAAVAAETWDDGMAGAGGAPEPSRKPKVKARSPTPAAKPAAPPRPRKAPESAGAEKAMAVRTATMPRASWVNVPEPAKTEADDAGKKESGAKTESDDGKTDPGKGTGKSSSGSTKSGAAAKTRRTGTRKTDDT